MDTQHLQQIGFIGAGNIAESMIRGLITGVPVRTGEHLRQGRPVRRQRRLSVHPQGTRCEETCSEPNTILTNECDGSGQCLAAGDPSCGSYRCSTSTDACYTSCSSNSQCYKLRCASHARDRMKVSMMFQTGSGSTELNEAAQQKVADYMQQRVGDMTCPDHGEAPTIVCSGTHLDNLQFDVRACCQKMVLKVKEKLAE